METLERNRVFDKATLEELLSQGIALMEQAEVLTNAYESSTQKIRDLAAKVPSEAKDFGLTATLDTMGGSFFSTEIYQEMNVRLRYLINKLMDNVYSYDTAAAETVNMISESTTALSSIVQGLTDLVGDGTFTGSFEEFKGKLEDIKSQWAETTLSLEERLALAATILKGLEKTSVFSRDPVNLTTGNFIYQKTDLTIKASISLSFTRFYNAIGTRKGILGRTWSHNYEEKLEIKNPNSQGIQDTLTHIYSDGKEITYHLKKPVLSTGSNISTFPETNHQDEVQTYTDTTGLQTIIKQHNSYRKETDQGVTIFDRQGRMTSYEEKAGQTLTFSYGAEDRLSAVLTETGESFHFIYDDQGKLATLKDHTGRTVTFAYTGRQLTTVTHPDGTAYGYRYGGNNRISQIINKKGIVSVQNEYDGYRRTTTQTFPDGGTMHYRYDDNRNRVTLTEQNGNQITYLHDNRMRHIKTIYADGQETYGYDDQNKMTFYRDKRGYATHFAYDDKGNLTTLTDPLGHTVQVTYDQNHRPLTLLGACGEQTKQVYDKKGNLLERLDALGNKTTLSYASFGKPVTIQKPDGSIITITYDGKRNIKTMTDERGSVTAYDYDALNRITATTDGNGNKTIYTYDLSDRIQTVARADGAIRTYTYDKSGKVEEIKDFDDSMQTWEYNILGKLSKYTDQKGGVTELSYDLMWNLVRQTLPNGAQTTYTYNRMNRLEAVTNPLGAILTYTYDPNGNREKITGLAGDGTALGEEISFVYDPLNRVAEVREKMSESHQEEGVPGEENTLPEAYAVTKYEYDPSGRIIQVTDALGQSLLIDYNRIGQIIKETDPLGGVTTYTYTPLGQVETIRDPAGRITSYQYEQGGLLKAVCYPNGTSETYRYDANKNIIRKENAEGYTLFYTYDSLNRLTKMKSSEGQSIQYTYDALGKVTSVCDANGNTTCYTYDPTGNLLKVTDPMGNEVHYTYDALGNLITMKQADSNCIKESNAIRESQLGQEAGRIRELNQIQQDFRLTTYQRNLFGQVEQVTDALGNTEHYAYDSVGRLLKKIDKDGYLTKYDYTLQGDISQITYADGNTVKLSYNPLRQLTKVIDWLGTTTICLDELGRATQVTDHRNREIHYEWGHLGERTAIRYPDGRQVTYHYDEALRLQTLVDGENQIHYRYNQNSRLQEKQFPNGMKTTYLYNKAGQLTGLIHEDKEDILDRYHYTYDALGNKIAIEKQRRGLEEESGTYEYRYDPLNRLEEVKKETGFLRSYAYDAFGNRIRKSETGKETRYAYNPLNQLIRSELREAAQKTRKIQDFGYDKRGNLTAIDSDGVRETAFHFDVKSKLSEVIDQAGRTVQHSYSGLGHRVASYYTNAGGNQQPERQIQYILDFTKNYHNLLGKVEYTKEG